MVAHRSRKWRSVVRVARYSVTMLAVAGLVICFIGCGISKEEHEKTVSEIEKTKVKLDRMKAELKETRARLDQANTKSADMEKTLTKTRNQLKIALKKHKREKQVLKAALAAARNELAYLRQKLEELTQNYLRTASELDMTKHANEILREQNKQ